MLKYMLDTCICIYTLKNRPQKVRKTFQFYHDQLCISTVTLMELINGAEKSGNPKANMMVLEGFVARLAVLDFDSKAAVHAGQIIAELERSGLRIGAYDHQIAGHARSQGLIIVTNNVREFERVAGLRVENWVN
ncbi:type II toxin-antitoxin system tRNA(fMet)-specific endonuclease VapC [Photorhabdus heterorhabditis]|uniref:Ribonuclease VapC n=1 Tax=Photorhabdus heterorhabditis TaxID=880156 RepID=A0A5B0W3B8_9GAMM|nr:tRNA(fMet)-specific endonuclease VapC [Photorhabdus heterorhabditis]KAA1181314.1 tRNA(fMet)-specific endonuclease VapC [Photorhabdus heterorhabditis]KOY60829.1 plasmid maintenance protein [Photorhabdus heterorhabditis]MBS9444010.1 tRNA(fMet)-specific endonuclease VapC [Photorhabdus heterorhabditis]